VVNPSEPVSRFLLKGDVRPDGKTIKHSAFMPPPTLRLSVFLVSNLSDQQIWELAVENVEPARGTVIGRGNLSVSQVVARRLKVSSDVDPTSRHANIIDWPEDRDERATIAKDLAADAYPAKMRH
jgi:hypothetical protein